ncbi:MAG: carboxypeptidase regulatory-like domain-containing protein, partial [Gemmatimonadota bacterium]
MAAQNAAVFVRVAGPDGRIPGANVELLAGDSVVTATATDSAGLARLVGLRAATYRVRVTALGHQARLFEDIRVGPGQARVVDVNLALAPVVLEGIRAVTDRIQIQRQNTDFSTTVDEVAMEMLPLSYEADEVVALTPGARPGHVWGGANFQANSYTLDGLSINHPGLGGDLLEPSINWIERVEVRGLGSGAEFGGFQGGLVNVVTRSGTNDFQGMIRVTHENDELNASNLVKTEIGQEVATRYDVEGQVRGPIVRDRLFYFLSGRRIVRDSRVLNHLVGLDSRYSPMMEEWTEHKLFGKLSWTTGPIGLVELSGGYLDALGENYGMNGYEGDGAAHRYTAPTVFGSLRWHRAIAEWASFDARVNHFSRDERSEAYGGTDVPGIRTFALTPPFSAFGNAPFTYRSAPSSSSVHVMATLRAPAGEHEHLLKVGGEATWGGFLDRRIRNGGLTWMPPARAAFDPADPSTWSHASTDFVPSQWGGEVHLDADVMNVAAFAQASLALGSRVVLSPGIRWGTWKGWLTPRTGDRFLAVQTQGWDPRVGLTVELDDDGSLVAKGHWGRYHQNMIAQMFDRAAGADVFTNEEIWYYRGPELTDPATRFTEAERDAMAAAGQFSHEGTVVLNETGPVHDYRQPYIDQWLVGLEKQFGSSVKAEALYTRRTNHDMIALVDRNRASNYVRYEDVRVYATEGTPLPYEGASVWMHEFYVPTYAVAEALRFCARDGLTCAEQGVMPPGFELADTANLTWDPDYVLTNAPDARREFGQFQFNVEVARPTWGASVSVVFTSLKGDLDNVSGYEDPEEYSPGPYVRVNEGVNAYGTLPNFSEREAKAQVWGMLPWGFRGGLVWSYATGDHFSPRFRISGMGFYRYRANDGALVEGPGGVPQ